MSEPIEMKSPTPAQRKRIINRARRLGRISKGLVLCDDCDTPADGPASVFLKRNVCPVCAFGTAEALDELEPVAVDE